MSEPTLVDCLPAVKMSLTMALAQIERGDDVTPNVAAMCILALRDLLADRDQRDREQRAAALREAADAWPGLTPSGGSVYAWLTARAHWIEAP